MQQKSKKHDDKEEDLPVDLVFCFQTGVILKDMLNKIDYIGTYVSSNSKNAMSKMIGSQIDQKLKNQSELEVKFEELIVEKTAKTDLVDEDEIARLNQQISLCAEELKDSTNSIYKTLEENPDIPKNLIKAKKDQKLLTNDLEKIQNDLVNGKFDGYNEIIKEIDSRTIDIDTLRKKEMELFKKLKKLNEDLAKEESDFKKDQAEMNHLLLTAKKKLAQTKLEEKLFSDYTMNNIKALNDLHLSNFREEERKMRQDIEDKKNEKDKISNLNEFVYDYLRNQKAEYERQRAKWEQNRKSKESYNEGVKKNLEERNQMKQRTIEELIRRIRNYREANKHLEDVAPELNYTNFGIIHTSNVEFPPINLFQETKNQEGEGQQ